MGYCLPTQSAPVRLSAIFLGDRLSWGGVAWNGAAVTLFLDFNQRFTTDESYEENQCGEWGTRIGEARLPQGESWKQVA